MKRLGILFLAMAALFWPVSTIAQTDRTGVFDYWVLSLSWSPSWCDIEGGSRGDQANAQCATGAQKGFVVHGLWPQYEQGWPEFCDTAARNPTRRQSEAMQDLMTSGGLAFYQWRKHGKCSGLDGADYYRLTRKAAAAVTIPPVLKELDLDIQVPVAIIEDAFIEANPAMSRDGITVTCRAGSLAEVRICLDKDLTPRACSGVTARDCALPRMLMPALR